MRGARQARMLRYEVRHCKGAASSIQAMEQRQLPYTSRFQSRLYDALERMVTCIEAPRELGAEGQGYKAGVPRQPTIYLPARIEH